MSEIWIIPLHIRPVVSHDSIKKGLIQRPRNGLDRLTLTEVGDIAIKEYQQFSLSMKLRKASPPFPWEMVFHDKGIEVSHLTGHFIGPSTFRSIFRFRFLEDTSGGSLARSLCGKIDRDPLMSDYWNDDTWNRFMKKTGRSKNEITGFNQQILECL